jgi:hypothetical protein
LLPLALGIGEGSAMLKPLAIAIISGLVFQLPLVLIVLPCLLAMFGRRASGRPTVTKAVPEPVTSHKVTKLSSLVHGCLI